jgi:hypothetical protein
MKRATAFVRLGVAGFLLLLAACGAPSGNRPPVVNSGSYNWRDAYRGPNGYPLPGWGNYFARPN